MKVNIHLITVCFKKMFCGRKLFIIFKNILDYLHFKKIRLYEESVNNNDIIEIDDLIMMKLF